MEIRSSPLSLFKISLLKVATNLWTTEESTRKIEKIIFAEKNALLKFSPEPVFDVQDRKDKVKDFNLSDAVRKKLLKRIDLVSKRLEFWLVACQQRMANDPRMAAFYLRRILWTKHGAVDIKRMELDLVENRHFNLQQRYLLACKYCLREQTIQLWNELKRGGFHRDLLGADPDFLVDYWTRYVEGRLRSMEEDIQRLGLGYSSVHDCGFWYGVRTVDGNDFPIKYFWRKLRRDERRRNLTLLSSEHTTVEFNCFEVFQFCASIMNVMQREALFESHATYIMEITVAGVLEEHLYEDVAKRIFPFMNYESFTSILNDLIYEASAHPGKRIKRRLLFFWTSAPTRLRRKFARKDSDKNLEYGFSLQSVVDAYKGEDANFLLIANEIEYSRAQEI